LKYLRLVPLQTRKGGVLLAFKEYKSVKGFGNEEVKIRKSRFISYVEPVNSEKKQLDLSKK